MLSIYNLLLFSSEIRRKTIATRRIAVDCRVPCAMLKSTIQHLQAHLYRSESDLINLRTLLIIIIIHLSVVVSVCIRLQYIQENH